MAKKKGFIRSTFQFSRWMGLREIKNNASSIKGLFTDLTKLEKPEFNETFADAKTRLNLSDADVSARAIYFLRLAIFYLFLALCIIGYAIYLYSFGDYIGTFMCLPIMSVLLSFCFKEHFWYTQLKYQRLGISFREWLNCLLKGEAK